MGNNQATIFIIAHAPTGIGLLTALRDIFSEDLLEPVIVLDIHADEDPKEKIHEGRQLLDNRTTEKILILTDLIGATPYNIAKEIIQDTRHSNCALISGVSLCMLLKAVNYQSLPLEKWVAEITDSVLEWVIMGFKRNYLV